MNFIKYLPIPGLRGYLWRRRIKAEIGSCGSNVALPISGSYTLDTLFLGNDVSVGAKSILWAVKSKIVMGNKVLIGPETVIMAVDHDITLGGRSMWDRGAELRQEDSRDVVLQGDVWVGARVIILKGVTVGRGAVIGAGSVVTKSVPPYSVVVGNPARPVRVRGTIQEILEHERQLYPEDQRLPESELTEALSLVEESRNKRGDK